MTTLLRWLQERCAEFSLEPLATYRAGLNQTWPFTAATEVELQDKLETGGHFLPLPKEPAALANVVEVSVVDYLLMKAKEVSGLNAERGTERGYPDIEFSGTAFGGGYHAVDIKVARRARNLKRTNSRITLYTGNTYFRFPDLKWPGTFRPFSEYSNHIDVIVLYTLRPDLLSRMSDIELIATEPWRIGSRQRSSTTREYLGAVMEIDRLRAGQGDFDTPEAFYQYWRKFQFKTGRAVEQQLKKLMGSGKGPKT